jgi:DNA/RNA endonuclease YhcR with UshA esterase domain
MTTTMETETVAEESTERQLTLNDRCDACNAGAYVKVTGVTGELFFCGHHYTEFENTKNMKAFAFDVLDERPFLMGENRAKGEL